MHERMFEQKKISQLVSISKTAFILVVGNGKCLLNNTIDVHWDIQSGLE